MSMQECRQERSAETVYARGRARPSLGQCYLELTWKKRQRFLVQKQSLPWQSGLWRGEPELCFSAANPEPAQ